MRIPLSYVIRRIGFLVAVLFTAATINFLIPKMAPRDPVTEMINRKIASGGLTSEGAAEFGDSLRKLYGLDKPLWQQYVKYIWNTMRFDLGYSIVNYPQRVNEIIGQTVFWTLGFVATSTLLAFLIGTVVGALVGWSKTSKWLSWLMPPLAMFSAVPAFIIALVLIYFLAFKLKAFPAARRLLSDRSGGLVEYVVPARRSPSRTPAGPIHAGGLRRWLVAGDARNDGHRGGRRLYDLC